MSRISFATKQNEFVNKEKQIDPKVFEKKFLTILFSFQNEKFEF